VTPALRTPGQLQALAELGRIIAASDKSLTADLSAGEPDEQGWLHVEAELDCANTPVRNGGVPLREKEHVTIAIPADFPFRPPVPLIYNSDLADQPHVQWGSQICLYQAETDWDASDGMMGFITRLADWFLREASGELDALGGPIDPPIAYTTEVSGCVVIEPDMPAKSARAWAKGKPWYGAAVLYQADDDRVDVLGWIGPDEDVYSDAGALKDMLSRFEERFGRQVFLAPVIVLPEPMSFEFPVTVGQLMAALVSRDISLSEFISHIGRFAWLNGTRRRWAGGKIARGAGATAPDEGEATAALYVFVGSPMRGIAGAAERQIHLAVWRLRGDEAQLISRLASLFESSDPDAGDVPQVVTGDMVVWILTAPISWERVYERRPEVVQRRDDDRPVAWLRQNGGKVILLLGCGALGAPIAEQCLRAGARKLILVDNKGVTPGVLIRQPYNDSDIGHDKAESLAGRLSYIGFRAEVVSRVADAMDVINADDVLSGVDLIIDATANQTVAATIELKRWTGAAVWPPVLTVGIGHSADRGFTTLAFPYATGAGADLTRKLALAAHAEPELAGVADVLFPERPPADVFVPEPGCSETTFRGSAAEVQALASYLFAGCLSDLHAAAGAERPAAMSARVVQLANAAGRDDPGGAAEFEWPPDVVITDSKAGDEAGYQIRISEAALADMHREAFLTRQERGDGVETGGTLFGQIDSAARLIWVSLATGPTPDSDQSQAEYKQGVEGVSELRDLLRSSSAGRLRFIGMWHTHPGGLAHPSEQDRHTMQDPADSTGDMPLRSLLVILGGEPDRWNAWLDGIDGQPQIYASLVDRAQTVSS
jgi:integrative and conjugative element protein (TIGR02256 family)